MDAAAEADRARVRGDSLGRLHGVPISIKSAIDVAGFRCECGSRFRQGHVAEQDATLVAKLRAEGAIVVGVSNTPDLLAAYETDNHLYGRTNSPWGLELTPGGSSGGEAAAISAGMVTAGFGSDGGGSVRVPAHFCGLFGLKPTPGVVSRAGHWPPCYGPPSFLGLAGPMTRNAEDLGLLLQITAGYDDADPRSVPLPVSISDVNELRGLRVGFFEEDGVTPIDDDNRQAVRDAVAAFRDAGCEAAPFGAPKLDEILELWWTLFAVGARTGIAPMIEGREDELHPLSLWLLASPEEAAAMTHARFLEAWSRRDALRGEFLQAMSEFDLVVCPVASVAAYPHGQREWIIDGQGARYPGIFGCSQIFNLLGVPAAVAPVRRTTAGLPVGVQIVARPYADGLTVMAATLLERAFGSSPRPPALNPADGQMP